MSNTNLELLPNLNKEVVKGINGFMLDTYLIALEGYRRGLSLTWYKAESDVCKMDRLNGSTNGKFFSLSYGNKTHYFFRSRGDKVSNKAIRTVQNKEITKDILLKKGVPVPVGINFNLSDSNEQIVKKSEKIGFPLVVKPRNGSMGKAVYTNILNTEELLEALEDLRVKYRFKDYIIEQYYEGNEYRVYVVGDEVVAATNRIPANIVGNGKLNIKELIEQKNKERRKNPYLAPKPIKVDFEVKNTLKKIGYDLESVPLKNEVLYLRKISNLSSGGDPIDATDQLSEEIKKIAIDALKALPNIPHAGVDIIVNPKSETSGVVLEINGTAEIAFHLFPVEGKARDIPGAIVDYYFPEVKDKLKSNYYFDYQSIQKPLSIGAIEEIKVPKPTDGPIFRKIFIVSGKLNKVGYMNRIKRQALRSNLHGYIKKLENGDVEVLVGGHNEKEIDQFKEICRKGSRRSVVEKIVEKQLKSNQPIQVGFHIIAK